MGNKFGLPTNTVRGDLPTLQRPIAPKERPGWSAPVEYVDSDSGTRYSKNYTFDVQEGFFQTPTAALTTTSFPRAVVLTVPPSMFRRKVHFMSVPYNASPGASFYSIFGSIDFYYEGSLVGKIPVRRSCNVPANSIAPPNTQRNSATVSDPFLSTYGLIVNYGDPLSQPFATNYPRVRGNPDPAALAINQLVIPCPATPDSISFQLTDSVFGSSGLWAQANAVNIDCSCDTVVMNLQNMTFISAGSDFHLLRVQSN